MEEKILLEAIGKMMDDKLEPIGSRLDKIEQDNLSIKADVAKLEPIGSRLDKIEQDNLSIKADIAKLNHAIVPKVNAIYEGIGGLQEKFNRLDNLETKADNHGDRIYALEQERKVN